MELLLIGAFSYCSVLFASSDDELNAIEISEAKKDPYTVSTRPIVCDPLPNNCKISRRRRSVRFSDISTINVIPLSPSSLSTTTTTTEEEEDDEEENIADLHDQVSCSLFCSPSSSTEEYIEIEKDHSLSPPLLPARLQSSPPPQQQQQQRYRREKQQNRHQFLGYRSRIRRVRKLLIEDIAHRRKREEEFDRRERRVKE